LKLLVVDDEEVAEDKEAELVMVELIDVEVALDETEPVADAISFAPVTCVLGWDW
jgi:hypothetical protein